VKSIIRKIIYLCFWFFPINKKIITFEAFGGKKFAGNCKAILDEMIKRDLSYKYKIFINKGVILENKYNKYIIYTNSLKWFYYTSVSKYWIKNSNAYGELPKKNGQIYINTWHSGSTLKKQGYDLEGVPLEKRIPKKNIKYWDWFVAGSKNKAIILSNSVGYKGNMVVIGMPRIDYLINHQKEDVNKIKKKLRIDIDKKIILYAPTYRDNDIKGENNKKILKKIKVPEGYLLLVKFHYYNKKTDIHNNKIWDISDYNDINELFIISDVLISDYSTVIFDYSNLKRPIILYAYDLKEYKKMRNFYINYEEEMPGPIVKNIKQLNNELANLQTFENRYGEKRRSFYKKFCSYNDGKATIRFVDMFVKKYFD
jgi:CDP-glycerol glycerophosphotransferase